MKNYCAGAAEKSPRPDQCHRDRDLRPRRQLAHDPGLWNLLQNSCRFTPEAGALDIRVFNEPASPNESTTAPVLVVEISGTGISPENMALIFKAFEQGERSRTRIFGGVGLGLAISRAIVELHGGTITASNDGENRGARFVIRLATTPTTVAPRDHSTPAPVTGAALSGRSTFRWSRIIPIPPSN